MTSLRDRQPAIAVTVFLLGMCALLNLYSTQPILGQLSVWAGISAESAAWTISAATIGVAVTAPVAGLISDKVGRRVVILCALGAMALVTVLACFSWSFSSLLVIRLAQGLCCPFVFAVTVAHLNEVFPAERSLSLNAVYVAGTAFGGFAGRALAAFLTDAVGSWRISFIGNAVLFLVSLLCAALFLPHDRRQPSEHNPHATQPARPDASSPARTRSVTSVVLTALVGSALLFQQVSSFTYMSLTLAEPPYALSQSVIGLIFAVFLVPSIVTPVLSRLSRVLGQRGGFLATQLIGLAGLGLTLSCVAVFAGQSSCTAAAPQFLPERRSTAVGTYLSGYYLGGALGAVVPAGMYRAHGWEGVVLLDALIVAGSVLLAWVAWRRLARRA
ncbi:MFS transporter [Corynebacterium uropygiale]|uniref:MFS transporter n=1 Tax=Corynebacterium uropygiale TaxID=1775911 RepID=A0A9X1QU73_9CORY|nr:MFS transporter [Corynebacterium uropygiale]MCF4007604.1 MFS transporter [Corynebacterium uropygiale]